MKMLPAMPPGSATKFNGERDSEIYSNCSGVVTRLAPEAPDISHSTEKRYSAVVAQFAQKNHLCPTPHPSPKTVLSRQVAHKRSSDPTYVSWEKVEPPTEEDHEEVADELPRCCSDNGNYDAVDLGSTSSSSGSQEVVVEPERSSQSFQLKSAFDTREGGAIAPPSNLAGTVGSHGASYSNTPCSQQLSNGLVNCSTRVNCNSSTPEFQMTPAAVLNTPGDETLHATPLFFPRRRVLPISPGAVNELKDRQKILKCVSILLVVIGAAMIIGSVVGIITYLT